MNKSWIRFNAVFVLFEVILFYANMVDICVARLIKDP